MKKSIFAIAVLLLAPLGAIAATPKPPRPVAPAMAAAGGASTHSSLLSWIASSSSTTANPGTVTVLRASGTCGATGLTFAPIYTTAPAGGPYSDFAVTAGTTYSYEVEAVIGGATSAPSNCISVTIPVFAPTNLAVVQGSSPTQAVLTWTGSTDSGTTVTVKRATGQCSATGLTFAVVTSSAPAAGPYTDTTIAAGSTSCYELFASVGGVVSSASATFQFSSGVNGPTSLTVVAN